MEQDLIMIDDLDSLPEGKITGKIIGASMEVLNTLRPGLDERVYENALLHELTLRNVSCSQQCCFPVTYKGISVGTLIPDLIAEDRVLVETKVVTEFNEFHYSQILGYLAITGLSVGLLINFKYGELKWKRVQP